MDGLFARYTVSELFGSNQKSIVSKSIVSKSSEPHSFITSATPHLGKTMYLADGTNYSKDYSELMLTDSENILDSLAESSVDKI